MTDTYKHGVYPSELPTQLVPVRLTSSAIPVFVGTAPGLGGDGDAPIVPKLCYNMGDFQKYFGWFDADTEDVNDYTLCEAAFVFFTLYGMGPAVFINVFDKTVHSTTGLDEVVGTDIIGTEVANVRKGLFAVEDIFPLFGVVPNLILAPGWSHETATGAVMITRAAQINGVFNCRAILDLDPTVLDPTLAGAAKSTASYTDKRGLVTWPKVTLDGVDYWHSTHLAGLIAQTDADHNNIPYASASNKRMAIDGLAGDIVFGRSIANDSLNNQGIITAINWGGAGWLSWGNRTGAYPASTDVKDAMYPVGRMFDWIGNTLVTTFQQKVDFPIARRLIDTIVDSANMWLNSLTAQEALLGGRIAFLPDENPATDVMDGIIKFHVWLAPPSPARDIEFTLEYDVNYLETLFG